VPTFAGPMLNGQLAALRSITRPELWRTSPRGHAGAVAPLRAELNLPILKDSQPAEKPKKLAAVICGKLPEYRDSIGSLATMREHSGDNRNVDQ
jgi:hypothetical protein